MGRGWTREMQWIRTHLTAPKGSYNLIVYYDWLQRSQKVISMRTRELKEPQEWKGEKHLQNVSFWELPIVQGTP